MGYSSNIDSVEKDGGIFWDRSRTEKVVDLHLQHSRLSPPHCARDLARQRSVPQQNQKLNKAGVFIDRPSTPDKNRALMKMHSQSLNESQHQRLEGERSKRMLQERKSALKIGTHVRAEPGLTVLHMDTTLHNGSPAQILEVHTTTVGEWARIAWLDDGTTSTFGIEELVIPRS